MVFSSNHARYLLVEGNKVEESSRCVVLIKVKNMASKKHELQSLKINKFYLQLVGGAYDKFPDFFRMVSKIVEDS